MQFRPYQDEIFNKSRNEPDHHIVVLPTGGGKGNLIVADIQDQMDHSKSVLLVVPTLELQLDLSKRLFTYNPSLENYTALVNRKKAVYEPRVYIGVYKSVYNYRRLFRNIDVVISDEAHRTAATQWNKILEETGKAFHKGYTATPHRLDGKPLNNKYKKLIKTVGTQDLIDQGYLCNFRYYSSYDLDLSSRSSFQETLDQQIEDKENSVMRGRFKDVWQDQSYGQPTLFFCKSIEFAEQICLEFNRLFPFKFAVISSKTDEAVRIEILKQYNAGNIKGIFGKNVFCEGVDAPSTEVIFLGDRTESLVKFLQSCGRGLRLKPNQSDASIFDFVGNHINCGLPNFHHDWDINQPAKIAKDKYHQCISCKTPLIPKERVSDHWTGTCPVCNTFNVFKSDYVPSKRYRSFAIPEQIEADMKLLTVNSTDYQIYRIITDQKMLHQNKVKAIMKLNIPKDQQMKAFVLLGLDERTAEVYAS